MTIDFDTLSEASYEGMTFPLGNAPSEGGNDIVEHVAYRRAGCDAEPTGWRAWKGTLTIPCVNTAVMVARYGTLWPDKINDLIALFQEKPRGELNHPTMGVMTVAITDVSRSAETGTRNGEVLTVKWVEHNASLALLIGATGTPTTDPTTTISEKAAEADAAGEDLAGYTPLADTIDAQALFLEETPRTYSEVLGAFHLMDSVVASNLTLPSVTAIGGYETTLALLSLRSALQAYRARFLPNINGVRYYTTPTTMSASEVALVCYGDLGKIGLVYASNTLLDPMMIPSGRVLTILPAT